MSRSRLVLLFSLLATLGACGGRTNLRSVVFDGGARDARSTPLDGADALRLDGVSDAIRRDGAVDATRTDGRLPTDGQTTTQDGASPQGTLSRIELTPASATIVVGIPYTSLVVTGIYSDGTTADLSTTATLASSNPAIVRVNGRSLIGQRAGTATITASVSGRTATARFTVTAAALQSLTIDGVTTVIAGQSILVTATGVFADGTKQDVTTQTTWSTSNSAVATATADPSGQEKISGVGAGTITLTATFQGVSARARVTVTAARMTRIDVTPTQPILQRGVTREFMATATFEDNTTADVTQQATWTSSDATIASITKSSTSVVVNALAAGNATITATVGSIRGSTGITVTAPSLRTITVTPGAWSANIGAAQAFTATANYSDNSTADITLSATWSSSAGDIVSISNADGQQGQAAALAVGTARIQASLAGISGTATVTISAARLVRIAVTPNPLALVLGLKGQLVATGGYADGSTQELTSQVAWSVRDGATVGVSNAAATAGEVTGLATGSTVVTASLDGISGTATVNVSQPTLATITVTPATATVSAGRTQQYTATGNYDNGATVDLTTQATWSSSNIAVAQISNAAGSNGLATSLVGGNTRIYAVFSGVTGTARLTVTAPDLVSINLTPATANIAVRGNQTFVVRAVYQNGTTTVVTNQATFVSSDPSVATITSGGGGGPGGGRGVATGVTAGTVTITATYQALTDTATLTVTAPVTLVDFTVTPVSPPAILVGATQSFQGRAVYSDGTTQTVTNQTNWTTSDANVASISNGGGGPFGGGGGRGQATGIGAGTATITGTYQGLSATATITVRAPQPTGVVITPSSDSIRVNGTRQFTALLTLEDGTTQTVTNSAAWTTSDGTIASITSGGGGGPFGGGGGGRGLATGLATGTVTITATYSGFTATATLAVTTATPTKLIVTTSDASVYVNQTRAFTATVVYDDDTTATVTGQSTWSSSDPAVAVISTAGGGGGPFGGGGGGGTATALAVGQTTITATYGGLTGSIRLTVTNPPVSFIQVTSTNTSIPVDGTTQFTATAVYADNSVRNVTTLATWASSDSAVAIVLNSGFTIGRATALSEGTSTISATFEGVTGSTTLTVAASVRSISIAPPAGTTVLGVPVAFTATATLSNNVVIPITGTATWISSDPALATILSGGANAGIATPVSAGTATITATYLGTSASVPLDISDATLASIAITPDPLEVANGGSTQLSAIGSYSDGTTRDLTAYVTWLSSAPTVASVSNATGSRGLLSAASVGNSTISAIFQGVTATLPATVTTP